MLAKFHRLVKLASLEVLKPVEQVKEIFVLFEEANVFVKPSVSIRLVKGLGCRKLVNKRASLFE